MKMKKPILAAVAAALLLAAVLCTAGCVNAPADPIVGTWCCEDEYATGWLYINQDKTGFTSVEVTYGASPWNTDFVTGTFVWMKNNDGTYTGVFDDGMVFVAIIDAEHGYLTIDDGTVYQKYPSGYSGLSGHSGLLVLKQPEIELE